jgi:hypothetical protein
MAPLAIIDAISQELLNLLSLVPEYTTLNGSQRRGKHARLLTCIKVVFF